MFEALRKHLVQTNKDEPPPALVDEKLSRPCPICNGILYRLKPCCGTGKVLIRCPKCRYSEEVPK